MGHIARAQNINKSPLLKKETRVVLIISESVVAMLATARTAATEDNVNTRERWRGETGEERKREGEGERKHKRGERGVRGGREEGERDHALIPNRASFGTL